MFHDVIKLVWYFLHNFIGIHLFIICGIIISTIIMIPPVVL